MFESALPRRSGEWLRAVFACWVVSLVLSLQAGAAQTDRKSFDSPETAAQSLIDALKAKDEKELLSILGKSMKEWIESGDPVADRNARNDFVSAYDQKHTIEKGEASHATLVFGEDDVPFPIPLVQADNKWAFDPELGKQEMIDRRVGENELNTIQTLLAIVDAQDEYAASDPEGKGAREYARSFVSSPGMRDGLYWPTEDETEPESPLGELVADAAIAGYRPAGGGGESSKQPFNGYYFRILNGQGSHASGGAYSYVINGRMMGGFAVIAWPAKYGASGFKTFMVNHDQTVYEADLGPDTKALVQEMQTFDPDEEWQKVEE
jgi:hypothetical protein